MAKNKTDEKAAEAGTQGPAAPPASASSPSHLISSIYARRYGAAPAGPDLEATPPKEASKGRGPQKQ